MAYDERRGEIVLFGGRNATGGSLGDTWAWNGLTWVQRFPSVSPPARAYHAMVYDRQRRRVILFSGRDPSSSLGYQDMWEWNGVDWTRLLAPALPSPRDFHAMAYFPPRRSIVLFGGRDTSTGLFVNDTWEWDGSTWSLVPTPVAPSRRVGASLTYASRAGRLVLFGGRFTFALGDTWEWDGQAWAAITATSPPSRVASVSGYDMVRDAVVLHGGSQIRVPTILSDTWEYTADPMLRGQRPIRLGAKHALMLSVAGDANAPYQVGTSLGTGPVSLGNRLIYLSPDALLLASTGGGLPSVFTNFAGLLDANGLGSASLTLPRQNGLAGIAIHAAFVTIAPSAPMGISSISNTFSAVITP